MLNDKIDLVIPFVNGSDPIWRKEFDKYIMEFNPHYGDGNINTRYDGEDILKFLFRSIDVYVPWINKIHLLLYGPSQIPEWLDSSSVHIVYHKEFIPKDFLPVFNSSAIECFLHNIPDLSEKFIYANDDFIFNSFNEPIDYFDKDGKPRNNTERVKYTNGKMLGAAYVSTFMNAAKLASHNIGKNIIGYGFVDSPSHDLKSCVKSRFKEIFKSHEEIIKNSITKFRSERNINIYFYILYDILRDKYVKRERKFLYYAIRSKSIANIKKSLLDNNIKCLCLNDVIDTTVENKKEIQKLLENKFPIKCRFEK